MKKASTIIMIIAVIIGLSFLLYPTIADYWNTNIVTQSVTEYVQELDRFSEADYQKFWAEAIQYNNDLYMGNTSFSLAGDMATRYGNCLNINGTGIMGYIEIPKLNVMLPIYHGTSNEVLATSIGHIDWTSLPTGGASTHCCLSGHRGLASAKLFTNLDDLREGDTFTLNVLDSVLTYQVDQIRTVLPSELSELSIVEGQDYCTLVTCTPYGINTHRLLVRGHRIETAKGEVHVLSEAVLIDNVMVAVFLAIPILVLLMVAVMLKKPQKKLNYAQVIADIRKTHPRDHGDEKKE